MSNEFALRQYTLPLPQPFETSKSLQDFGTPKPGAHHDESWPVLYILTNSKNKTAYIGQTTNYQRRMKQHAANVDKDFDRTLLIDNPTFNQSATFEFENRLIELFCADEKYQVTNANNGYAQFDYFERPQYRQKFRNLWTKLRKENYAIHPIEELENTDLFKFSPFKTLTPDQYETIETIYKRLEQEHEDIKHGGPKKERVTVVNGAPGTGKTTLAKVIAHVTGEKFEAINAVSSGVPELRKLIAKAQEDRRNGRGRTIVFIDEIHRFNKAQQDVLPYVENGTIVLIGATTENPFFEINSPLLSRMKVVRLEKLQAPQIQQILERAIADPERGFGNSFKAEPEALRIIADFAAGDARSALNILEQAEFMLPEEGERVLTVATLRSVIGTALQRYDKKGDQHYDIISAFIKSMRGGDADAALHYLARMIEGGEDVRFVARRVVICAAEDVGLADPQALVVANAAAQAADFVGWPEAQIPLAEAVCYIANAPKSNTAYMGIAKARADVRSRNCGSVPKHLRDAHYPGAAKLGHGIDYKYPHNFPGGWVEQQYLPDELMGTRYYIPSGHGQDKGRR